MTNETDDMNDRDAAVRRSYRQLSDETTPGELDERILAAAARAARPGYVRPVRWMRPLAWAATIVLSVSVILHMAELPGPADVTPPLDEQDAVFDKRDADRADGAMEPGSPPVSASADDRFVPEEVTVAPEPAVPEAERRERAVANGLSADTATAKTAESFDAATRALPDSDMLRRASELARQQDSGSETVPLTAEMALHPMAMELPPDECTDAERRSGETWFACIERLRAAGHEEAAATELTELGEAFPDFEIP